ncbi:MAG: hypothetical protein V3U87_14690 [Methylococcaceae bacterium]
MQTARIVEKNENNFSSNIIEFKLKPVVTQQQVKTKQNDTKKACFQTDERYFCKNTQCSCAKECKKLIAAWMR